jgi:hypothetical protein
LKRVLFSFFFFWICIFRNIIIPIRQTYSGPHSYISITILASGPMFAPKKPIPPRVSIRSGLVSLLCFLTASIFFSVEVLMV